MVGTFQRRDTIADIITLGSMMPILIVLLVGWRAASPPRDVEVPPSGSRSLLLGAAAGATGGLILAALALAITAVNFRWILVNATPGLAEILQFGQGPLVGRCILDPRRRGARWRVPRFTCCPRRSRARRGRHSSSRSGRRCWSRSSVPCCATSA